MYQKHVDLDYKDVSTHGSLLPMLCTVAAHEAKLLRGRYLGPGSFKNHMKPHRTPNMATDSPTNPESNKTPASEVHNLFLAICGQQPLTQHVVLSQSVHAPHSRVHLLRIPLRAQLKTP